MVPNNFITTSQPVKWETYDSHTHNTSAFTLSANIECSFHVLSISCRRRYPTEKKTVENFNRRRGNQFPPLTRSAVRVLIGSLKSCFLRLVTAWSFIGIMPLLFFRFPSPAPTFVDACPFLPGWAWGYLQAPPRNSFHAFHFLLPSLAHTYRYCNSHTPFAFFFLREPFPCWYFLCLVSANCRKKNGENMKNRESATERHERASPP